jgi:hypothetical protein
MRRLILSSLAVAFVLAAVGCGSEDPAAVVVDTVAPAAVLDVDVEFTGTTVEVTWAAASEADVAGYRVSRYVNGVLETGNANNAPTVVTTNALSDTPVPGAVAYRYEVSAFDATGNVGPVASSLSLAVERHNNAPGRASVGE